MVLSHSPFSCHYMLLWIKPVKEQISESIIIRRYKIFYKLCCYIALYSVRIRILIQSLVKSLLRRCFKVKMEYKHVANSCRRIFRWKLKGIGKTTNGTSTPNRNLTRKSPNNCKERTREIMLLLLLLFLLFFLCLTCALYMSRSMR